MTKKAIRFLQSRHPEEKIKEDPVPFNTQSLIHDLLLNDLLEQLKKRNPERVFVHGKLIHYESSRLEQIPDAVMIDPATSKKVAIELELTAKSDLRYRQIITNYRLSKLYDSVLYIVGHQSISDKLVYSITGYKRNDRLPAPPTGIFKILPIKELT